MTASHRQPLSASPLLEITDLRTVFDTPAGTVRAVDGVDLVLGRGETLAVVGESGCGKTVLALSVMRLVPAPPGRLASGSVVFRGENLLTLDRKRMQDLRGDRISMIFQEPMTSLNPVFRVGEQVAEIIRRHRKTTRRQAMDEVAELFHRVGIADADQRLRAYPHQLSGGLRQRVMIAMAVACRPDLILADEPTTALDVTIQAQILALLDQLKREMGTSLMLITHDLGVVAQMAERVIVMYAGKVVEEAPAEIMFDTPRHPYTRGLLASLPRLGTDPATPLPMIPGQVPSLYDLPRGCRFQDRCPDARPVCREEEPALLTPSPGATVRCWNYA